MAEVTVPPDALTALDQSGLVAHTESDLGRLYALDCMEVMGALPDVGKNLNIRDTWGAPIAVERRAEGGTTNGQPYRLAAV